MTRGEGGQNLIGAEQAPLLGLIRTQELLAARGDRRRRAVLHPRARLRLLEERRRDAARSGTTTPSLGDVVWAIRTLPARRDHHPLPAGAGETHGHHTASAILARRGVQGGRGPGLHPEQLKRCAVAGEAASSGTRRRAGPSSEAETSPASCKLDVGGYNPLLGALLRRDRRARAAACTRARASARRPPRGRALEYFSCSPATPGSSSILDGVDITLGPRSPAAEAWRASSRRRAAAFIAGGAARSIPALLAARDALAALADQPWKAEKLQRAGGAHRRLRRAVREADAADAVGGRRAATSRSRVTAVEPLAGAGDAARGAPPGERRRRRRTRRCADRTSRSTVERTSSSPGTRRSPSPYWLAAPPGAGTWTSTIRR